MGKLSWMFTRCSLLLAALLAALVLPASDAQPPGVGAVSFTRDVMAVLSKAGCNSGACHGNENGKASFKLSLRGESPELDYVALTQDQFGRRINVVTPEESLLLQKATATLAHEGGQRFGKDALEYGILLKWISSGAQKESTAPPAVVRLEVSPAEKVLIEPEAQVQLKVKAVFADGTARDVTRLVVYEPASTVARANAEGLVEQNQFGESTVLVRYLNVQTPVRIAFVRARPGFVWNAPAVNNYIDEAVFAKLQALRMNPSEPCSDQVFLRRAYLDLLGLLPTAEEARRFVYDQSPGKRARLVDELLERPEFADHWALKWSDLLRNEERVLDRKGVELFHRWVRQSIMDNKPMDQFAREIIAARGSTYANAAANFYRANRTTVSRAEAVAQLFLGVRVQCAQCHSHPFDRWTQDDYYDWARLFARVDYKVLENRRRDDNDGHEFKGEQVVFLKKDAEVRNPRTESPAKARFLGAEKELNKKEDELRALADWVAGAENPYFAKVQANRIWYHLMGRGIVDPIDDFRATNPASHPELLDGLARDFVQSKFNMRHLIRTIMASRSYQSSSQPNETNEEDEINYSHASVRRLTAEQLLDCQAAVLGTSAAISGYPEGTRAMQMAGSLPERRRNQKTSAVESFLAVFGKPPRLLPSECERSCEPTMGQAFQLLSGPVLHEMLGRPENALGNLTSSGKPEPEIIQELFWRALSRPPNGTEETRLAEVLRTADNKRAALEDIAWSLLNSHEFIFRN